MHIAILEFNCVLNILFEKNACFTVFIKVFRYFLKLFGNNSNILIYYFVITFHFSTYNKKNYRKIFHRCFINNFICISKAL